MHILITEMGPWGSDGGALVGSMAETAGAASPRARLAAATEEARIRGQAPKRGGDDATPEQRRTDEAMAPQMGAFRNRRGGRPETGGALRANIRVGLQIWDNHDNRKQIATASCVVVSSTSISVKSLETRTDDRKFLCGR